MELRRGEGKGGGRESVKGRQSWDKRGGQRKRSESIYTLYVIRIPVTAHSSDLMVTFSSRALPGLLAVGGAQRHVRVLTGRCQEWELLTRGNRDNRLAGMPTTLQLAVMQNIVDTPITFVL